MPAVAALPMARKLRLEGILATFVVPAPKGCNLNCSFCIVRARREAPAGIGALSVGDYVRFLDAMAAKQEVGIMSLQGYEPLLSESWAYSEALLKRASELGIVTALVTNGTYLIDHIADLVRLDVAGVTVSLDASVPELHDLSRGTPGAFVKTVSGLKEAAASSLRERIMVASVLQPRRAHYLRGMPALLASLGIKQWVITPVLRVGQHAAGGPVQRYDDIVRELLTLQQLAKEHGIDMLVDDEFEHLVTDSPNVVPIVQPRFRRLPRLSRVIRLTPTGSCSVGEDILRRVDNQTPHWKPQIEDAGSFVERLLA